MVGSAGSNRSRGRWQPTLITTIAALEASLPQAEPLVATPGDFR